MANWNVLMERFTQGELSPLLYGQTQNEILREGCQIIKNGYVVPQGPVTTRPGTTWLTSVLNNVQVRLWRFVAPNNVDLFALFNNGTVELYDWQEGVVGGTSGPYAQMLLNNNFVTGIDNWVPVPERYMPATYAQWRGIVRALDGTCQLGIEGGTKNWQFTAGDELPAQKVWQSQELREESQDFILEASGLFTQINRYPGQYVTRNLVFDEGVDWYWYARLSIGTTEGGAEIGTGDTLLTWGLETPLLLNVSSVAPLPAGTAIFATIEFLGEAKIDGAKLQTVVASYNLLLDDVFLWARPSSTLAPIELPTVYADDEVEDLHFIQSPYDNRELICLHPNHAPQVLYADPGPPPYNWRFEPYVFTNQPSVWGVDGLWPSIGAGVQGRLCLTGLGSNPDIIWMSKSGEWTDFDIGTAANPDDAIEFTAQVRDVNTWIVGGKNMLYGDRLKEYQLGGQDVITPLNLRVSLQTSFGTERNPQKILMGKNVVLATGGNNDLRLLHYNRDDGGYISPNIILKAEHLGFKEFKRHFYTRDPNQALWNIMKDGTITICSFDDELKIQAWSRFETQGLILDGCVINDSQGRDVVILAISRTRQDDLRYTTIETIADLRDRNKWKVVDCEISVYPNPPVAENVLGFNVLEGLEVDVFYDNQYVGKKFVDDGGGIDVEIDGVEKVTCGLNFQFKAQTFPTPSLTRNAGITSKKRYSKTGIRGLWSVPPIINGQRPPTRGPQSTMNANMPYEDILEVDIVDTDINEQGTITVEETLPYRLTIAAIYGKLTSNQL